MSLRNPDIITFEPVLDVNKKYAVKFWGKAGIREIRMTAFVYAAFDDKHDKAEEAVRLAYNIRKANIISVEYIHD